jgi:hypothetical protein
VETTTIRLAGLNKADVLELYEYVDRQSVTVEDEKIPEGDFGDLGLSAALVLLSIPALKGLIAYLAYRHRGKSFEQTIEIERPDGTREKTVIRWRDTSAEPIDAALARELASSTGIPAEKLLGQAI